MSKLYKVKPLFGDNPHPLTIRVEEDDLRAGMYTLYCLESNHGGSFPKGAIDEWLATGVDGHGQRSIIEETDSMSLINYRRTRIVMDPSS
jgi:hypothetical protein